MIILMVIIGALGGFSSGLLGIGGAIIIVPLLLQTPQLFGFTPISGHVVSGLSMVQVFLASLSGAWAHYRRGNLFLPVLAPASAGFSIAALLGALVSAYFRADHILVAFVLILMGGALGLLLRDTSHSVPQMKIHVLPVAAVGAVIGLLSGIAGIGGGLLIIPSLTLLFGISLNSAIGTSLGVVCVGSLMGTIGKAVTGQIVWNLALPLGMVSVAFAQAGAIVHRRVDPRVTKAILLLVVLLSTIGLWYQILT